MIIFQSLDQGAQKKHTRIKRLVEWILKNDTQLRFFSAVGTLLHSANLHGLPASEFSSDNVALVSHKLAVDTCRASMAQGELSTVEVRHAAGVQNSVTVSHIRASRCEPVIRTASECNASSVSGGKCL